MLPRRAYSSQWHRRVATTLRQASSSHLQIQWASQRHSSTSSLNSEPSSAINGSKNSPPEKGDVVFSLHAREDPCGVYFNPPTRRPVFYEHLALRDMCQCSLCIDQSTRQRQFSFSDIPPTVKAHPKLRDAHTVEVRWTDDVPGFGQDHVSLFTEQTLLRENKKLSRAKARLDTFNPVLWDRQRLEASRSKALKFNFESYQSRDAVRDAAASRLLSWGIIFIEGVPSHEDSVQTILERLGPLRNTFYGPTWDVRSVPGAKNVAYTAKDLGFHQDLLYMANPPGLQALHVLRASTTGGESLFVDGARAVEDLLKTSLPDIQPLLNFPVTFHYRNAGEWYEYARPTLEGGWLPKSFRAITNDAHNSTGRLMPGGGHPRGYPDLFDAINWSPPFQGPSSRNRGLPGRRSEQPYDMKADVLPNSDLYRFHKAARALASRIEDPKGIFETRLEPGTCVIFNNRRIMHARRAFPVGDDSTAQDQERWLRGAYGDLDPLMSLNRVIAAAQRGMGD